MSYLDAIILGIVQGLTEFLPISSSGHLVLFEEILGAKQPGVTFELVTHVGTLLAVLVYFRSSILTLLKSLVVTDMAEERKMFVYLIVGTIPAGLVGVLFEDFFDQAFGNPAMAAAMLLVTGGILLSTRFVPKQEKPVKIPSAIIMGIGQALAIMPGISRSGSTIAAGLLFGIKPDKVAEFSFLLAIPAIGGATILKFKDLLAIDTTQIGPYLVGAIVAFVFGLIAVYAVLSVIRKGKFEYFAYYCFAAGALGLYLLL